MSRFSLFPNIPAFSLVFNSFTVNLLSISRDMQEASTRFSGRVHGMKSFGVSSSGRQKPATPSVQYWLPDRQRHLVSSARFFSQLEIVFPASQTIACTQD